MDTPYPHSLNYQLNKLLDKLEKQAKIWQNEPFERPSQDDQFVQYEEKLLEVGRAQGIRHCGETLQDLVSIYMARTTQ